MAIPEITSSTSQEISSPVTNVDLIKEIIPLLESFITEFTFKVAKSGDQLYIKQEDFDRFIEDLKSKHPEVSKQRFQMIVGDLLKRSLGNVVFTSYPYKRDEYQLQNQSTPPEFLSSLRSDPDSIQPYAVGLYKACSTNVRFSFEPLLNVNQKRFLTQFPTYRSSEIFERKERCGGFQDAGDLGVEISLYKAKDSRNGEVVHILDHHTIRPDIEAEKMKTGGQDIADKIWENAIYQLYVLDYLNQSNAKVIFCEGLAKRIEPESEEGKKFKDYFNQVFPNGLDQKNFSNEQITFLYKTSAAYIYYALNDNVTLIPAASKKLDRKSQRVYEINNKNLNAPDVVEQVYVNREALAAKKVKKYLRFHPGEKVYLMYGAGHMFSDNFASLYPNESKSPSFSEVFFPVFDR